MPILGVIASSIAKASGAYDSISTTFASSAQANITSIPATYKHLELRIFGYDNSSGSGSPQVIRMRFNSDTGSNYTYNNLTGEPGTGAFGTQNAASVSGILLYQGWPGNSDATNNYAVGASIIRIYNYANTNYPKQGIWSSGFANPSGVYKGTLSDTMWYWNNASNITSIQIGLLNSSYIHCALYGIS